jgi:3',5'-cyclic AMP phosphodiesterase CpdA
MRIAHLSDVHLLSLEGARLGDFANKRAIGGVNLLLNRGRHYQTEVFDALVEDLNRQAVTHVACTGDLTNLALASEFRFARDRFDRIALGPSHVTCIPGNHDGYVPGCAGLFEAAFDPYCAADADWRFADGDRWPVVRIRGDLAVVALSTCLPTTWFMAYGELGRAQLDRLAQVLGDPRLDGKFRLVLIHHPPAGKHAKNRIRGLHDHPALAAVLARTGADLVLHGHEHLHLQGTLAGPAGTQIPVFGVESGSYVGPHPRMRATYRIYSLAASSAGRRPALVGTEVRAWKASAERFDACQRTTAPA